MGGNLAGDQETRGPAGWIKMESPLFSPPAVMLKNTLLGMYPIKGYQKATRSEPHFYQKTERYDFILILNASTKMNTSTSMYEY